MSIEEYNRLRSLAESRGALGISALVRACVTWLISNSDTRVEDLILSSPETASGLDPAAHSAASAVVVAHGWHMPGGAAGAEYPVEVLRTYEAQKGERRLSRRYAIQLAVSGRTLGARAATLAGATLNVSGTGALLVTPTPPRVGTSLRVWIEWPIRSPRGEPLHLTGAGKILWSAGDRVGIGVHHWEFREGPLPSEYVALSQVAGVGQPN